MKISDIKIGSKWVRYRKGVPDVAVVKTIEKRWHDNVIVKFDIRYSAGNIASFTWTEKGFLDGFRPITKLERILGEYNEEI